MILVLAGTADGREIAGRLHSAGLQVLISTATEYGGDLAEGLPVRWGALDAAGFRELIQEQGIKLVVDASHPFAVNLSNTALAACQAVGVRYIRFERKSVPVPENGMVFPVDSYTGAAEKCAQLGNTIFLAIGSNHLDAFTPLKKFPGKKVIARVLPTPGVVQKCTDLGFSPGEIVALQGPFGYELNRAMLLHYGAEVLVTKESGDQGGAGEKIQAALDLGIAVVLVTRPKVEYPVVVETWEELRALLGEAGSFFDSDNGLPL